MPDVTDDVRAQLAALYTELQRRALRAGRTYRYYGEGEPPFPEAVIRARLTRAYRLLMPMSNAPWGSLVVDSVQDRLEVAGIRTGITDLDEAAWRLWQDNGMDAESKLAHNSALLHGRAFATVWPGDDDPEIVLDSPDQMIVLYREGSRRRRLAALRCWADDSDTYATLYRPDGIFKFQMSRTQQVGMGRFKAADVFWEMREVPGEQWPLPNVFGVVPVVEIAVNRQLKAGAFPYARGEFEHCTGLMDRINLLTFLGLVVALWMGFPLRGVIGHELTYDADENPQPPFNADADSLFVLENPDAKLASFEAADRRNLAVFSELDQLAVITKTPRHYFPLEQGMSNISADAIRASEGALHAKVTGHKASLGEGWEEVLRLAGLMSSDEVVLPAGTELLWKDHESRSMAERADAATKLATLLPWQAVAEKALNATQEEINRWQSMKAGEAMTALLTAVQAPAPVVEPVPVAA